MKVIKILAPLLTLLAGGAAVHASAQERVPAEWLTVAERTDFAETGDYEETLAYARRLDEASPWIRLLSFGTSPQGRELMLLVASKDEAFDPASARRAGKPLVLVQNAIHAGEIEGKDASLMLLRDIAVTRQREGLLDGVTLLVMPLFNVDGYGRFGPHTRINQNGPRESGWRATAQNLNLNRDYLKADAPEMRAWLSAFEAWRPHLLIDNHTTDGADHQYVVTYQIGTSLDVPPSIAAWSRDVFLPRLTRQVEAAGHPVGPYLELRDPIDPAEGFQRFLDTGRYSSGYAPLRNVPGLLVETHMLKPYEPRVRSTYETMTATLELLGRDGGALLDAVRTAEAWSSEVGRTAEADSVPLGFELSDSLGTLRYRGTEYRHELSEVSGAVRVIYGEEPIELEVPFARELVPGARVRPPLGYAIPAQWEVLAERLRLHGVPVERLEAPVTGQFEVVRFDSVAWAPEPFEGRHLLTYRTNVSLETDTLPAGSYWVPLGNASARLAMQLLEPEGPDALVRWGFLDAIFERKEYAEDYVMENVARAMLAGDAELREQFQRRVAEDPEFRASPQQRLGFFYERTPFWDDREDRYPVLRVVRPLQR
ncbi:MAG: M14 family metallopeptidase [Gemmatimonadota bacterium]